VSEMPREQGRATTIPVLCCDLQEELRNTSTAKGHDQMYLKNPWFRLGKRSFGTRNRDDS
jgi:hypothetical protein